MSAKNQSFQKVLSELALKVRNHDPVLWEAFVDTFDAYSMEVTVAVTQAPPAEILVMQGRAQQCLAMLRVFKECTLPPKSSPAP